MHSKLKSFFTAILASIVLSTGFYGCKSRGQEHISDPEHPMIVAYTSGIISILSPIRIALTNDAMKTVPQPGDPLEDGVFKFSPSVSGRAYWVSENIIEFKPDESFDPGEEYKVTFNISKLTDTGNAPRSFSFWINTIIPTFYYQLDGLSLYNRTTPNLYYMSGSVTASDYIPIEKIKSLLVIEPDDWDVKWEHDFAENKHYFRLDSIKSRKERFDIQMIWDGKSIGYDFNYEEKVAVPAENEFGLIDIQVIQTPEQYVQCTFSEPIDEKQRLVDYFSLSNGMNLRFAVELNVVRIYPPSRETGTYELTVESGLKSVSGRKLAESTVREIVFEQLKPAVKFVGKGSILPASNNLHIAFQAVNYQSVNVKVTRIYENNILQFLQINQLDGSYELYRVGKVVLDTRINLSEKKAVNLTTWNTYSMDLAELIKPEPGAIYRIELDGYGKIGESDNRYDYDSYYESYKERVRNVLVTDIGLTAKYGNDGVVYVAASSLTTAQPLANVVLKLYNYINQPIGEAVTDKDGMAVINCSESPHILVAQQEAQKAYLLIEDGYSLSLSSFDVSGVTVSSGIKGFIYGERGVWRPGDTLFLAFMLEDKLKNLPENHPVNYELRDPNGQIADKQVKTAGTNGLYRFTSVTSSEALTGLWEAKISVGGQYFTKSLRIETVKPNRLKIDFKLDQSPILSSEGMKGNLSVHWLHGAVARNLPVRINAHISQTATVFDEYKGFTFDDPEKSFDTEEQTLVEGHLDENGELKIAEDIHISENSPGMLRMFISTRVFEEGGDFSIDEFSTTYSPYQSYVGVKPPQGDGYYQRLEVGDEQAFEVVTLDETGKPVARNNIHIEIFKVEWNWWWSSFRYGYANYSSSRYKTLVYQADINTARGKGEFRHKWNDNGYYSLKLTDPVSKHTTSIPLYVSNKYWWGGDDEEAGNAATMLQVNAGKQKYNVGENAVITFPSSPGARALVGIEAGEKVLRSFWAECNGTETSVTIPTTADMVPNVYIHISLIQPHANTENDAPMRLYGIIPLLVEDPQTHLYPIIDMPGELRPEEPFKVKISEQNGQLMSYTLAIVDDGLLDLTRFRTPSPWNTFYAKEALGLKTWDLYDMVIGAYGGKIEQLFAIGGGDAGEVSSESAAKANRFKPVVKYIGPFTVEKGKTNEHDITLPPYIGSVRTMVIATNGRGYGSAEKTTPVRKPLMALSTLPRVVGPGETVWVPATIFTMDDKIKQVNVEIEANDLFQIDGDRKKTLAFTAQGDQTAYFKVNVKNYTGIGRITISASSGSEKSEHTIEIDVRNPNPRVYNYAEALVEAGKDWDGTYALPGMQGTNKATMEVSYLPPINLGQRLAYLIDYPHGCIEQTTSSVFPQLYLDNVMELNTTTRRRIEENIKAALLRYRQFITPQGGFGYWPGYTTPDGWGTSYAGHFMLEAESRGYALPAGMKQSWLRYQTNRARNWKTSERSDIDQAYRLYTLALAKQPEQSAMSRLKEYDKLSVQAKWRLAAAYALIGNTDVAKSLIANAGTTIAPYSRFSDNFGTPERDQAMILETLTLLKDRTNAFVLVKKLSDALNSKEWMSTQTTAYALLSVSKYAAGEKGSKDIHIEYTDAGKKQTAKSNMPVWQTDLDTEGKTGSDKIKFSNKGQTPLYVRITTSGIPEPGNEKSFAHGLEMTVKYVDSNGNSVDVKKMSQGTDFKAIVTVKNTGTIGRYTNLILSEIFPSGWEIINTRLNDEEAVQSSSGNYMDIRDDRVYHYFGLGQGSQQTFEIPLSATYRGRFYLPAFSCEAMYDASIMTNNEGMWVEVVE